MFKNGVFFFFFFNVGPPKEDILSGHLLSPIFQSSLHVTFTFLALEAAQFLCLSMFLNPHVGPLSDILLDVHHAQWAKHLKSCFFCGGSPWKMWKDFVGPFFIFTIVKMKGPNKQIKQKN